MNAKKRYQEEKNNLIKWSADRYRIHHGGTCPPSTNFLDPRTHAALKKLQSQVELEQRIRVSQLFLQPGTTFVYCQDYHRSNSVWKVKRFDNTIDEKSKHSQGVLWAEEQHLGVPTGTSPQLVKFKLMVCGPFGEIHWKRMDEQEQVRSGIRMSDFVLHFVKSNLRPGHRIALKHGYTDTRDVWQAINQIQQHNVITLRNYQDKPLYFTQCLSSLWGKWISRDVLLHQEIRWTTNNICTWIDAIITEYNFWKTLYLFPTTRWLRVLPEDLFFHISTFLIKK